MITTATRPGPCEKCDNGIRPGQQIRPLVDGGWAHVSCPAARPVCPNCWTLVPLSGACASCGWEAGS